MITRRGFVSGALLASAGALVPSAFAAKTKKRKIQIGHTGITWSGRQTEAAITSISSLGFYGFETFGDTMLQLERNGGLLPLLQQHNLQLISGYCSINLTDPAQRDAELAKADKYCDIIKKNGGRIYVVGPNGVKRDTYDFAAHKADIVTTLNELSKRVVDKGLTPVLHQHTGTCIESHDETYAVLETADTKLLKFGPDVGQLTKGGSDAVEVVKHFLPIVEHMHLKDYNGKDEHLSGYCPLGQGTVNVPAILDLMEKKGKISGMVMVELDNDGRSPSGLTPEALATQSHDYLVTLGVQFRKI
jgi:inosose dehydratase